MSSMRFGRVNVLVGAVGMFMAACGGLALGITFDQQAVREGFHELGLVRFYLREGHSHGMLLSLYNLIIGLLVDSWFASDRWKRTCSLAACFSLVLPIGLLTKGAMGASAAVPPIGIIGALGLILSLVCLIIGYFSRGRES